MTNGTATPTAEAADGLIERREVQLLRVAGIQVLIVLSVPKERWAAETVRAHARELRPGNRGAPDEPLSDELAGMPLTRESLARFVEVRCQFGQEEAQ